MDQLCTLKQNLISYNCPQSPGRLRCGNHCPLAVLHEKSRNSHVFNQTSVLLRVLLKSNYQKHCWKLTQKRS